MSYYHILRTHFEVGKRNDKYSGASESWIHSAFK